MTTRPNRIDSLDIVRGVVMVLMAIDHVRVYSGVPAGGAAPAIFFTRWITHFCAPSFAFFAGTSAYLLGLKLRDHRALAKHLATRGALLVLLELTVMKVAWTFNIDYSHFILAGVIWMLGWCMILLAALVRFSPKALGIFGVAVILVQQLLYPIATAAPAALKPLFQILYTGGAITLGAHGPDFSILYVLIPWIGVMAAGYAFGTVMTHDAAARNRFCTRLGLSMTAAFVVIAGAMVAFGHAPENGMPALFRMLSQSKYPPSQLFLLMTLGPVIALLPVADSARGRVADALATFGRVPFFYYVLHIPLIHASALAVRLVRDGALHQEHFATAPFVSVPDAFRWSLGLLYLVFAIDVAILYWPCRWFARYKSEHKESWARFI